MQAAGCTAQQAERSLERTGNDVKLAILTTVTGSSVEDAKTALRQAGGFLRKAIEAHSS